MDFYDFLNKYPNGAFLSANRASRLLRDLRKSCKRFINDSSAYIINDSIFISPTLLFKDRIYISNETDLIYPPIQNIIDSGGEVPSGSPGANVGPPVNPSPQGTHTLTLEDFYNYIPVVSLVKIKDFFNIQ
jgi:hypothetical protein